MSVSVSYRLTGSGWAECSIETPEGGAHVTASYLSDALGDLLRAVVGILRGAPETTAIFTEEPGEYLWVFRRAPPDRVLVRILWFDDWQTQRRDERGELIFEAQCRLRTLAGASLAAAQQVLGEHGEEGYEREWVNYPFPVELMRELKRLLDEGAGRCEPRR
jgi:hypothetical protein